jgi:drug/metabolite transporter (DMT)-like permease
VSDLRPYVFALGPLAAAALWGGMFVVSKWSFAFVPPVTMGFLRVAVGSLALWLGVHATHRHGSVGGDQQPDIDRADWPAFVGLGGWVAVTIATQFLGTELTNASQGSLLTVLTPIFAVGLGASVLDERVTWRKGGGIALAAVGAALVVAGQYDLSTIATGNAVGVGLLIVASFAWAGYTVWGVSVVRKYSALTAATYSTIAATPMLAVLAAIELTVLGRPIGSIPLTVESIFATIYLGLVSTAAAWYLWYKGLEFVSAGTVAVFYFLQPVVGISLGALLLGEQIGTTFVVGSLVVGSGVWLVSQDRTNSKRQQQNDHDQ